MAKGATATVTVKATGEGLTYKWYYKNKGATKFTYTSTFSGDTYTMEMTDARAGRQIYCVITDKYGNSTQSQTVTLNMESNISVSYKYAIAGEQYALLVVKGTENNYTVSEETIVYIDQKAADNQGVVSFQFIPKSSNEPCVVLLGGKFNDGSSPKVLDSLFTN